MADAAQDAPQGADVQGEQKSDAWSYDAYLEGIEDSKVRDQISQALDTARKEWDSSANRKIQEQAEKLKAYQAYGSPDDVGFTAQLYNSLANDPINTIQWIDGQFNEHQGRSILKELMDMSEEIQKENPGSTDVPRDEQGKALTEADVEKLLQERLSERENVQAQEAANWQAFQEAQDRAENWMDDAVEAKGLELSSADREYLTYQAADLLNTGTVSNGQEAINKAVEAFNSKYGDKLRREVPREKDVRVAVGGEPVLPQGFDPSTSKNRKEAALQILKAYQNR